MNTSIKTILASTLLVSLFAATSANAGRAGEIKDYVKNVETKSVKFKKVNVKTSAPTKTPIFISVNR